MPIFSFIVTVKLLIRLRIRLSKIATDHHQLVGHHDSTTSYKIKDYLRDFRGIRLYPWITMKKKIALRCICVIFLYHKLQAVIGEAKELKHEDYDFE